MPSPSASPTPSAATPPTDGAAGVGSLRTLGTGATQAAAGNDTRFSTAYNVVAYGAKGDGTTDDSAAIQAAIDAAPNGSTVLFPRPMATYRLASGVSVSGREGLTLQFSPASVGVWNITNASGGAAFTVTNSKHITVNELSCTSTDHSNGVALLVKNSAYQVFVNQLHGSYGKAALQIGDGSTDQPFNIFVRGLKADSGPTTGGLTYGVLFYSGVNVMLEECYVHDCTTAFKRLYVGTDPWSSVHRLGNVKLFHCIAEGCSSHGFDFTKTYALTMDRPYIEAWGQGDATPTSFAIKIDGFTYAQLSGAQFSASYRIMDALFYGGGSIAGGGKCVSLTGFWDEFSIVGADSSIPRDVFLVADDSADATVYGAGDAMGVGSIEKCCVYGTISLANSRALWMETLSQPGGTGQINNLAPGTKSVVQTEVADGLVSSALSAPVKFSPMAWKVRTGGTLMNVVADTASIGFNNWASATAAGFDGDRAFSFNLDNATGRNLTARSAYWNTKWDLRFSGGSTSGVVLDVTQESDGTAKPLWLNPTGGVVNFGSGGIRTPGASAKYVSTVSAGGTSVSNGAHAFDTSNALNAGSRLLTVSDAGSEKFYVKNDGVVGGATPSFQSGSGDPFVGAMIRPGNGSFMKVRGDVSDSASAIAVKVGSLNTLATSGAKVLSLYKDNFATEVAYIDIAGQAYVPGGIKFSDGTVQTTKGMGAVGSAAALTKWSKESSTTPSVGTLTTFAESGITGNAVTLDTTTGENLLKLTQTTGNSGWTAHWGVLMNAPGTADYTVRAAFRISGSATGQQSRWGVGVRCTFGTTFSGYVLQYLGDAASNLYLTKYTNGAGSNLKGPLSVTTLLTAGVSAGDVVRLQLDIWGSMITAWVNGIVVWSFQDTSFTAAGQPAIVMNPTNATQSIALIPYLDVLPHVDAFFEG